MNMAKITLTARQRYWLESANKELPSTDLIWTPGRIRINLAKDVPVNSEEY